MAKSPVGKTAPLSFVEIVMRADAETIRAALEARVKVDGLLAEREEAYRRIAALEEQIEQVMGEPGVFVFPEPPMPVAGFSSKPSSRPAPKKPSAPKAASTEASPKSAEKSGV
ncbi:MAG: hypothetical protein GX561_11935 [Lentisphaerae bacterium]|jgi:hypothetical protein|nr:hypothetical protein [Lentisphaerota bacterium]